LRGLEGLRLRVRAIERDRVESVDHHEDARAQGNLLALQPARIAGAVPLLVVGVDDRHGTAKNGIRSTSCLPISGWRRMIAHSSGVSGPGFNKIASGMPILPMSWSSTPWARSARSFSGTPYSRAVAIA